MLWDVMAEEFRYPEQEYRTFSLVRSTQTNYEITHDPFRESDRDYFSLYRKRICAINVEQKKKRRLQQASSREKWRSLIADSMVELGNGGTVGGQLCAHFLRSHEENAQESDSNEYIFPCSSGGFRMGLVYHRSFTCKPNIEGIHGWSLAKETKHTIE